MRELTDRIANEKSLDKFAQALSARVNAALEKTANKQRTRDLLNGVWLGHPLHSALVAIPCGSWTVAAVLDFLSLVRGRPFRAATPAIAIGLAGGLTAAPAGLADWDNLSDQQRRIGLVHFASNAIALTSYALSLLFRLAGGGPRRLTAFMGFLAVSFSGYLGGHMVYQMQAAVAHQPHADPPEDAEIPIEAIELEEGQKRRIQVGEYPIMVACSGGRLYAVSDVCPHLACSLATGDLEDGAIVCPCHGSKFALADGRVLAGPATAPVQVFDISSSAGKVRLSPRAVG